MQTIKKIVIASLIILVVILFLGKIVSDYSPGVHAKAGEWSEAIEVTRNVRLDIPYGVHFFVRVNDTRELTFESDTDGNYVDIPSTIRVKRLRVKPDKDVVVRVIKEDYK
jgi:hypothetical protein